MNDKTIDTKAALTSEPTNDIRHHKIEIMVNDFELEMLSEGEGVVNTQHGAAIIDTVMIEKFDRYDVWDAEEGTINDKLALLADRTEALIKELFGDTPTAFALQVLPARLLANKGQEDDVISTVTKLTDIELIGVLGEVIAGKKAKLAPLTTKH